MGTTVEEVIDGGHVGGGRRTPCLVGIVAQARLELGAQVGVEPDVVVGEGEGDQGRDVLSVFLWVGWFDGPFFSLGLEGGGWRRRGW